MDRTAPINFDLQDLATPCFVVDTGLIQHNLNLLNVVKQQTGCKILLALKGFAMHSLFPQLATVLDGCCASSPHEAKLAHENFGPAALEKTASSNLESPLAPQDLSPPKTELASSLKEVHSYAAAFSKTGLTDFCRYSNHLVFNSFSLLQRFIKAVPKSISCGIRINPNCSLGKVPLYDPCAPMSRLGVTIDEFRPDLLKGIDGLHFHTLCEQNADALRTTLQQVEQQFGKYIHQMNWINFGGGHHITRNDYDVELLCRLIQDFQKKYRVQVYLEPGETVALNAGFFVSEVLDIIKNQMNIAILDCAVPAHLPDVIEMPYRPHIIGSGLPNQKAHTYRLGGISCLAGDIVGDYSFDAPLQIGQKLIFTDMAHYTMVKTTTFNGIQLPTIYTFEPVSQKLKEIRRFGYTDFKNRL